MFAGCTHGNEALRTNTNWPYGRVAVIYRESMASPIIANFRDASNAMSCRV